MPTKRTRYVRLKRGTCRREGYQYRYKEATGFTPWLEGDDELIGIEIARDGSMDVQFRAPRKR